MSDETEDFEAELESLLDKAQLSELNRLPTEQRGMALSLIRAALHSERRSMDGLFESMTHTIKYIPSFLLQKLTKKFIEPPIAARITEKLELKHSVSVAKGLSAQYIASTSLHTSSEFAVALLSELPRKLVREVVIIMLERHPLKLLDLVSRYEVSFVTEEDCRKLLTTLYIDELTEYRRSQLLSLASELEGN